MKPGADSEILIVYDGECPVCSHYVKGVRLREAAGCLRLLNARDETEEVTGLKSAGYDLNKGMVVKIGETIYFGADGMNILSLMTSPSGLINRSLYLLFRSSGVSRVLYPFFRNMRLLLLKILVIDPIKDEKL